MSRIPPWKRKFACDCYRTMYRQTPVVVVAESGALVTLTSVFVLSCMKCPSEFLIATEGSDCVADAKVLRLRSSDADDAVKAAMAAYEASLAAPVEAPQGCKPR